MLIKKHQKLCFPDVDSANFWGQIFYNIFIVICNLLSWNFLSIMIRYRLKKNTFISVLKNISMFLLSIASIVLNYLKMMSNHFLMCSNYHLHKSDSMFIIGITYICTLISFQSCTFQKSLLKKTHNKNTANFMFSTDIFSKTK